MLKFVLPAVILALVAVFVGPKLKVMTGITAKLECSAVYVQGRPLGSAAKAELAHHPWLALVSVEQGEQSITVSIFGGASRTAIFREGFGCTLTSGAEEPTPRVSPKCVSKPLPDERHEHRKLGRLIEDYCDDPNPESEFDRKNVRAVVVLHNGNIVGEHYGEGFDADVPLHGWSMGKSVLSALVGARVLQGAMATTDRGLASEWDSDDPRSAISVDDMLFMSDGLDFKERYDFFGWAPDMLFASASTAGYGAASALIHTPGERWYYSSATTNLLSRALRFTFASASEYLQYPREALFNPIGMCSAVLEVDEAGTFVASSFDYATARDWARFGLLFLNDGVWDGKRILPEGWVEYSVTPKAHIPHGQYGAQWWRPLKEDVAFPEAKVAQSLAFHEDVPTDAYFASGFEGQAVVVIPSRDVVIVRLGLTKNKDKVELAQLISSVLEALS